MDCSGEQVGKNEFTLRLHSLLSRQVETKAKWCMDQHINTLLYKF
jgi:hypothetical protein